MKTTHGIFGCGSSRGLQRYPVPPAPPKGGMNGRKPMTEAHPCSRILVLAGDVSRHIGDGMIQHALVEQIRSAFPQADICCAASARPRARPSHERLSGYGIYRLRQDR